MNAYRCEVIKREISARECLSLALQLTGRPAVGLSVTFLRNCNSIFSLRNNETMHGHASFALCLFTKECASNIPKQCTFFATTAESPLAAFQLWIEFDEFFGGSFGDDDSRDGEIFRRILQTKEFDGLLHDQKFVQSNQIPPKNSLRDDECHSNESENRIDKNEPEAKPFRDQQTMNNFQLKMP